MQIRLLFASCLLAAGMLAEEPRFPAVPATGDSAGLGRHLQRSLGLMASSTAEQRHTVRVLFYGQSITEGAWWQDVAAHLRTTFPHANLIIENRALGGHSSDRLVKTAEADLYPFQPDLVLFHVYGGHLDYETIIRRIRERTVADILITTDHPTRPEDLSEEADPAKLTPAQWHAWFNRVFLPGLAQKYGAELADVRGRWAAYLKTNGLTPDKLLSDSVHPNAHGNFVMAGIVRDYLGAGLVRTPAEPDGRTRDWRLGRDVNWDDDRLRIEFDGTRIDAVWAGGSAEAIEVLIDGQRPTQHAEVYGFERTSAYPGSSWPALLRVQSGTNALVAEEWTATLDELSADLKTFRFAVAGAVTGPDGEGVATNRFVSRSGRIVIEPGDWNLAYGQSVFKKRLPVPFRVTWRAVCRGLDRVTPRAASGPGIESSTLLVQGLKPGRHVLELRATDAASRKALAGLRAYRPPLRAE
jgi:hypothetical protein